MDIFLKVFTTAILFAFMEGVAWFTHKYIMHGFLWSWHKSHHTPGHRLFELNDLFGLVFAIVSASLIITGIASGFDLKFYAGLGILLYGIAYFLVHDIFIHQRIPLLRNTKLRYFKAMRFAHKVHHKVTQKEGAEAFGFLFVPKKFLDRF